MAQANITATENQVSPSLSASSTSPSAALDPRQHDIPPITSVAIVGLGYVGLPLSLQFARSDVSVIGIDIDPEKVEALQAGRSYIKHIEGSELKEQAERNKFSSTTDFAAVGDADAVVICVPTPLNKNREPDLSFVLGTGRSIGPFLRKGHLVVLESTTYPGTTDEDLRQVLEETSGLKAGTDFALAFSPEREDPGNPQSVVRKIPKVVGGLTPRCAERAVKLYSQAVDTVVPVSSCRVAEATKLLENIFRSVNIALVNELKLVYDAMGIDIWEVIEAAKTKPFGFMPFYPGPGLGGHCIPIDPFYLSWKAREFDMHTRFIYLAGEINTEMPKYVIGKMAEALNRHSKPIRGSRVLLLGMAYKPDVDDLRESPSLVLMEMLQKQGATVDYYDPHIPVIPTTREHASLAGIRCVEWSEEVLSQYDVALVATGHKSVRYDQLAEWVPLIVDTRNAMNGYARPGQLIKA